ncbi:NAD(P)-dependent oxidoreductase [Streptomyces sp. ME18-1-4]|uniref:NAD(P)-dependent oxidoreductase n=1 Tax=Streptomyces sp. ME18-1-4 TaxID=3028685 RepID=UPI0029AA540C|nr:NAD(P)-binding domain-containing protein [Streptomyces sp. ME18-1-4]MDX3240818.1 NAD(P)-binding domain-containing protein [Streptomyces sp. ME18-1-4]
MTPSTTTASTLGSATAPERRPVSVIGLGPMGRALASAFLTAGHPLTVWNRTPGRAGDLAERGARVAASVGEAMRDGQVIVVCLMDYTAVRTVLDPPPANRAGRILVNLTSGTPAGARAMADWAAGHGIGYLDGAILTPTPTIGTPSAALLFSGAATAYEAVRETMAALGGTGTYLGADPGRALAHEVALLDLFATSVHGMAHAFALASAEGVAPRDLAPAAVGMSGLLAEMIPRWADQLEAGRFPGERSTIASAATTLAHLIDSAAAHGLDVGALTAAKRAADRAVAAGHGADGLARFATVLRTQGSQAEGRGGEVR